MKLYGSYTSPFVRHCRIALLENNINYEFVETDQATSAVKSPTKRVPFLADGNVFLTDSTSILKYIREKSGQSFLVTLQELDQFCTINTALDSTTNLFFLRRDGVDTEAYEYLKRQSARIQSSLAELNQLEWPSVAPYNDAQLRLACYLAWGLMRKCISLETYSNLQKFLDSINSYAPFAQTKPPAA
jgi:glutathione S-transferase